jgi:hypothetical protein
VNPALSEKEKSAKGMKYAKDFLLPFLRGLHALRFFGLRPYCTVIVLGAL